MGFGRLQMVNDECDVTSMGAVTVAPRPEDCDALALDDLARAL
jgi:hypothetical protein